MDKPQIETLSREISAVCSGGLAARLRFRGRSAQVRRREKRRLVLELLQRFGSTDPSVIARLLGASRSTLYKTIVQLESEGLIQPVPVEGCLTTIYILTESGRAEAEVENGPHLVPDDYGWCEAWARAPVYPSKLPISHIPHDHLTQHIALDLIEHRQALADEARAAGFVVDSYRSGIDEVGIEYVPARTLQKNTPQEVGVLTKIPDLVLGLDMNTGRPGAIIAVEVQQTYQRDDEVSMDLSRYAQEMGERNTRLFKVIYASTRPSILKFYESKMAPNLGFWAPRLDGKGYFNDADKPTPATPKIIERFEFRDISKLHKIYYPGS